MPVQLADLEKAIRDAFPVSYLQIEDQSSGCGESYSVLLVSEVGDPFNSSLSTIQ